MQNINTQFKSKIMRRVYIISYLRTLLAPVPLKLYATAIVLWSIGREVWVSRVLENAPGDSVSNNFSFFANAVWHTEFMVQVLVLGFIALSLWLLRDIFTRHQQVLRESF